LTKTPVRASRAKAKPEAKATKAPAAEAAPTRAKKTRVTSVKSAPAKAVAAKPKPSSAKPTSANSTLAKAAPARPPAKSYPDAKNVLKIILTQVDDMKAEDTVTIDHRGTSSESDYVVVTTGRSNRHVGSIADRVVEELRKVGVRAKVEGMANCDWVLIDAGAVIVHVFRPEVRTFYNLEKMWAGSAGPRHAS
jgi:ribosome-associated protein